jgi:hypothetical protein
MAMRDDCQLVIVGWNIRKEETTVRAGVLHELSMTADQMDLLASPSWLDENPRVPPWQPNDRNYVGACNPLALGYVE